MKIGLNTTDVASIKVDAVRAERQGFDYLGCGEHLFFHGPTPNALTQLAVAAGATESIRLVSSLALLPLYPAALLAKLAATIDLASGGRFELGVGAGGEFPAEFLAAGVDRDSRFRRLDEGLPILRALLGGERVTSTGEFARLEGVALDPPPLQPAPPIWLGGRKGGAMRRAGRFADVWLPYLVDPPGFDASLTQVRDVAADAGRDPADVSGALFAWVCVAADPAWARESAIATVSETYSQDFAPLADKYLVFGTPDQVAARLKEYEQAGVSRVLIQIAAAPEHRDDVVDTIATQVLPHFR